MFETIKNTKIASFKLGGEKIDIIPAEMTRSANSYSQKVGDLLVIVNFETVAKDFYRWTVKLKNIGTTDTAQITEFYGIDLDVPVRGEASWESIHGDNCSENSFLPLKSYLCDGDEVKQEPDGGRSSQGGSFPYFDVTSELGSAIFSIGWTGQWSYTLKRTDDTAVLHAGFTDCDMYLAPGESIRSIGALVYSGTESLLRTRQDFRRIFREKLSPAAKNGGRIEVPISLQVFDRYFYNTPEWKTEEGQIHCIKCAEKCRLLNTYWLDAAWFREGFPTGVGNYDFHVGFPNGLKPVSDFCHELGFKFMLWFEPERNDVESDTVKNHSEMMLHIGDEKNRNYLFNLSDDAACDWLIATLTDMIRDNGIDIYRQDFNMNPLEYWRSHDAEGKKGYTENKYITNLYRFWDALLTEFPGLVIDNCASGGNRLDFEMNMRSLPMWRSDTNCFPASEDRPTYLWHQNQTIGLSRYLPYHAGATWTTEANAFRSSATMGCACNFDVMNENFNAEEAIKPLEELNSLVDCWNGDFYPLTQSTLDTTVWCGYQLALCDSGFCVFYRRKDCEDTKKTFIVNAIDLEKEYEVSLSDNDYIKTTEIMKGSELAAFTAEIPNKNQSLILRYKAVETVPVDQL